MKLTSRALVSVFLAVFVSTWQYPVEANNKWTDQAQGIAFKNRYVISGLVYGPILMRCLNYFEAGSKRYFQLDSPFITPECSRAARLFNQILDIKIEPVLDPITQELRQQPVAFSKTLHELLEKPSTLQTLSNLKVMIDQASLYSQSSDKIDLMSALTDKVSNPPNALQLLAVLFQDVSPLRSHLAGLSQDKMTQNSQIAQLNIQILNELITKFTSAEPGITCIPITQKELPKTCINMYHFFVPAYLAQQLRAQGISAGLAAFFPFLFNYFYEVASNTSPALTLVWEPRRMTNEWSIFDMYLGYIGASRGAGLALEGQNLLDFKTFKSLFLESPTHGLKEVVKSFIRVSPYQ